MQLARIFIKLLLTGLWIFPVQAQKKHEYNQYSFELSWGGTSALSEMPDLLDYRKMTFIRPELAGRYMFNSNWGIKASGAFDIFKSLPGSIKDFQTINLRFSVEGVWNIGRDFHFERFTERFSLQLHGGGGVSSLRDARTNWLRSWRVNIGDDKFNLLLGTTAQYKINPKWVLQADVTGLTHFSQHYQFDFGPKIVKPEAIRGYVFNFQVGATYYFGKKKEHYDWAIRKVIEPIEHQDSVFTPPLVVLDDRDVDGVTDARDKCPDVPGIKELDGCPPPANASECLLDEFPVVEFEISNAQMRQIYKKRLDSLIMCLKMNPAQKFIIHGHSDNVGDPVSIEDISYRRALSVKRYLTENGIDKDRLLAIASGAEKPALPDSVLKNIPHNRMAYFQLISNNAYDIVELSNGKHLQGLFFTIQVGAFGHDVTMDTLAQYGRVFYSRSPDKLYARYAIGVFHSSEEAGAYLESLKAKGLFPDAFVTAYYLGERIANKRAKNILLEKGSAILEQK